MPKSAYPLFRYQKMDDPKTTTAELFCVAAIARPVFVRLFF